MLKTVVTEPGYVQCVCLCPCVCGAGCNLVYLYVLQFKRWECGNERSVSSVGLRSLQHSCVSVNRATVSSSVVTSWEVLGEQDEQVSAQRWKHTGQGDHAGFIICYGFIYFLQQNYRTQTVPQTKWQKCQCLSHRLWRSFNTVVFSCAFLLKWLFCYSHFIF